MRCDIDFNDDLFLFEICYKFEKWAFYIRKRRATKTARMPLTEKQGSAEQEMMV